MRPDPSNKSASLQRLRSLTHLLDNAITIPGTRYRVGLDPILGLLPGGGDLLTSALSAYMVWEAARLGLPRATVTRMVSNLVLDTLLGSLPVAGDLFDATWKANTRNLALLEAHLESPRPHKQANRGFVLLLLVGFVLLVMGLAVGGVLLVTWLWRAVSGAG